MLKFGIFVTLLLIMNVVFWFVGGPQRFAETVNPPASDVWSADPAVIDVFIYTLEEEVRKKEGLPPGGYVPSMFLEVFPGLAETDFEGVEASIGYYTIEQGRLVHKLDDATLIHDTATAITRRGMETLLYNIATRTNINLQADGTITDIMSVLIRN